jgi:hypothetical protein
MATYEAKSLEDIAKMFDSLATKATLEMRVARTQKAKEFLAGRGHAYIDCAGILRNTILKG